jgi:ketosteroid isomerase-like protein
MHSPVMFASPEDCAKNFYESFSRANIDEMMSSWCEDEEVCCVHPGAAPMYGYAAVRSAWAAIFRNSPAMRLEIHSEHWNTTIGMAIQQAIEWVYVGTEEQPRAPVFVTNAFLRTPQGWRMIVHHASPVQAGMSNATSGAVLH